MDKGESLLDGPCICTLPVLQCAHPQLLVIIISSDLRYTTNGGSTVKLEPRQRNVLIIGTLVGAVLGAGVGWLLAQPAESDSGEPRQPVRPGDVLKLTNSAAGFLRQLDDLRRRI